MGEPSAALTPLSSSSDMLEATAASVRRANARAAAAPAGPNAHLLALLQGDAEGLDWTDLEVSELVLRLLSGLLREQTLTMETAASPHASHAHSFPHLPRHRTALAGLGAMPRTVVEVAVGATHAWRRGSSSSRSSSPSVSSLWMLITLGAGLGVSAIKTLASRCWPSIRPVSTPLKQVDSSSSTLRGSDPPGSS